MNIFDPDAGEAAMVSECARRALDMVSGHYRLGLTDGEVLATAAAYLGLAIANVPYDMREDVIANGWEAVMDVVRKAKVSR